MNRLPFKSFHSSHFNSDNINQWNIYLDSLQQQNKSAPISYRHTQQAHSIILDPNENKQNAFYSPEENQQLSKETVAIFEFSEAYAKQQGEEDIEKESVEKNKTNWILDEYNDYHDNGNEVPATSLVIISNDNKNDDIVTLEHLLNSTYLQTCHEMKNDSTLILWPVVPLKL